MMPKWPQTKIVVHIELRLRQGHHDLRGIAVSVATAFVIIGLALTATPNFFKSIDS